MNSVALGLILGQLVSAPAGYTGTIGVGDRSEARARAGFASGIDLETAPYGTITLTGRRSAYSLAYGPRIVLFDIGGERSLNVMHEAGIRATYGFRRFSLGFSVDGTIGKANPIGLLMPISLGLAPITPPAAPMAPPAQTPTPDPNAPEPAPAPPPTSSPGAVPVQGNLFLAPATVLYTGSLRVGADMGYVFSRRWSGNANASFLMSGGIDFVSQFYLPPSRTWSLGLGASYSLSPADALTTSVTGSYTLVLTTPVLPPNPPRGGIFRVISITESYSHTVSRRTNASVGIGVTYLNSELPTGAFGQDDSFNATGFGSLGHVIPLSAGSNLTVTGNVNVGAFYNPIAGQVQQTATIGGGGTYTRDRATVTGAVSASTTLPVDEFSTRSVTASLGAGYQLTRGLSFEGGVRVATQVFPSSLAGDIPAQWVGFVAATLTAPVVQF